MKPTREQILAKVSELRHRSSTLEKDVIDLTEWAIEETLKDCIEIPEWPDDPNVIGFVGYFAKSYGEPDLNGKQVWVKHPKQQPKFKVGDFACFKNGAGQIIFGSIWGLEGKLVKMTNNDEVYTCLPKDLKHAKLEDLSKNWEDIE